MSKGSNQFEESIIPINKKDIKESLDLDSLNFVATRLAIANMYRNNDPNNALIEHSEYQALVTLDKKDTPLHVAITDKLKETLGRIEYPKHYYDTAKGFKADGTLIHENKEHKLWNLKDYYTNISSYHNLFNQNNQQQQEYSETEDLGRYLNISDRILRGIYKVIQSIPILGDLLESIINNKILELNTKAFQKKVNANKPNENSIQQYKDSVEKFNTFAKSIVRCCDIASKLMDYAKMDYQNSLKKEKPSLSQEDIETKVKEYQEKTLDPLKQQFEVQKNSVLTAAQELNITAPTLGSNLDKGTQIITHQELNNLTQKDNKESNIPSHNQTPKNLKQSGKQSPSPK